MERIETWNLIFTYEYNNNNKELEIYDSERGVDRFIEGHNYYKKDFLFKKIKEGLNIIYEKYRFKNDAYVIISKSTNLKIPVEIRIDRQEKDKQIAVIPTILNKKDYPYNKKNEIEVFVEKTNKKKRVNVKKISYCFVPLIEDDNYKMVFYENIIEGKIIKEYIEIHID